MPFRKEDTTFDCSITLCDYNESESCTADEDEDDLLDSPDCVHYASVFDAKKHDATFKDLDKLHNFLEERVADIPFKSFDEYGLRVVIKEVSCSNCPKGTHVAVFQMSEATEKEFEYRPEIDGDVLTIHKSQMSLEI
jgi:hypothetical protein